MCVTIRRRTPPGAAPDSDRHGLGPTAGPLGGRGGKEELEAVEMGKLLLLLAREGPGE